MKSIFYCTYTYTCLQSFILRDDASISLLVSFVFWSLHEDEPRHSFSARLAIESYLNTWEPIIHITHASSATKSRGTREQRKKNVETREFWTIIVPLIDPRSSRKIITLYYILSRWKNEIIPAWNSKNNFVSFRRVLSANFRNKAALQSIFRFVWLF